MNAFPTFVDLEHGVDKTEAIAEWLGDRHSLVFCRPAGFGRSEWLDVLQAYLDEAAAPQFDVRFAGTWIAAHPTRDKNARRVMRLSFKGCSGPDGKAMFLERLREGMREFLTRYPDAGTTAFLTRENDSPAGLWDLFTCEIMPAVRRLTVLIDNADGTADVGDAADCRWEKAKRWLTVFYETLKASQHFLGTRVYAVGENPSVMMELKFSGFFCDVTTDARYAALCGIPVGTMEGTKTADAYRFSGQSSAAVRRTEPKGAEDTAQRQQRLQGILQGYSAPTVETVMPQLQTGAMRLTEPVKAAWQAAGAEERLLSELFYVGFLTYSEKSDRTMQWAETAFRA